MSIVHAFTRRRGVGVRTHLYAIFGLVALFAFASQMSAQYQITASGEDVGNPVTAGVTVRTASDATDTDGVSAVKIYDTDGNFYSGNGSTTNSVNHWSSVITLPFNVTVNGVSRSQFCVSKNGLLTFTTGVAETVATASLNTNTSLPHADMPDNTFAYLWDDFNFSLGSLDDIYMHTYGSTPNRQVWIRHDSFKYGGPTGASSFTYFAIVFEETTNKVYCMELYGQSGNQTKISATIGFQADVNTAVEVTADIDQHASNGSPNLYFEETSSSTSGNDYYIFTPPNPGNDPDISGVTVSGGQFRQTNNPVSVDILNFGSNNLTGGNLTLEYSVDGGSNWVTQVFVPTALDTFQTETFTFTTPWANTATGEQTVQVRINPQLAGDPDASDESSLTDIVNAAGVSPVTVGVAEGADDSIAPLYRSDAASTFDHSSAVMILTAEELSSVPIGVEITDVEFFKNNTAGTSASADADMTIWLKNTSDSGFTSNPEYGDLTSGAVKVYEVTDQTVGSSSGWMSFGTFNGDPFFYEGDNVMVIVTWDISDVTGNPTTGAIEWSYRSYDSSDGARAAVRGASSAATSTSTLTRDSDDQMALVRFDYDTSNFNFALVREILTEAGENTAYSGYVTGYGGTAPYTYALGAGAPAWVSLQSWGEISGTPPADSGGTTVVVPVQVTDNNANMISVDVLLSIGFGDFAYVLSSFDRGVTALSNPTSLATADDALYTTNFSYDLKFWDKTYTSAKFDTNGFITFNSSQTSSDWSNQGFPQSSPILTVCAFHDDLDSRLSNGFSRSLGWGTTGSAPNRVTTWEWVNISRISQSSTVYNAQVKVFESSGVVEIHYHESNNTWYSSGDATVGIQDDNSNYIDPTGNNNGNIEVPATNFRFSPKSFPSFSTTNMGFLLADEEVTQAVTIGTSSAITSWTWTLNNAPTWASIDSSTGTITMTPPSSEAGNVYGLQLQAEGSDGTTLIETLYFKVLPAPIKITNGDKIPNTPADTLFQFQMETANVQQGATVRWSLITDDTSDWMSIDANGVLSGTPPASQTGQAANVVIRATDGIGLGRFTSVETSITVKTAAVSVPFREQFESGANSTDLTWVRNLQSLADYQQRIEGKSNGNAGAVLESKNQIDDWTVTEAIADDPTRWEEEGEGYQGYMMKAVNATGASQIDVAFDYSIINQSTGDPAVAWDVNFVVEYSIDGGLNYTILADANADVNGQVYRAARGETQFDASITGLTGTETAFIRIRWLSHWQLNNSPKETYIAIDEFTALAPLEITSDLIGPLEQDAAANTSILGQFGLEGNYTWGISQNSANDLPDSLVFDTSTGAITGSPDIGTTYGLIPVTFELTDGVRTIEKVVNVDVSLRALSITTVSLPSVEEDSEYSTFTLVGFGGTELYEWSVDGTGDPLPAGLTLATDGFITGDPDRDTAGTHNIDFRLTDSDSGNFVVKTLTMVVTRRPLDLLSPNPLPAAVEDSAYSYFLQGFGGTDDWEWGLDPVDGDPLPVGIFLDEGTGEIAGTPIRNTAAQTYDLKIVMSDTNGEQIVTFDRQFVVNWRPLEVVTQSPIASVVEDELNYEAIIEGFGGNDVFSWAIDTQTGADIPAGMSYENYVDPGDGFTKLRIFGDPAPLRDSAGTYNLIVLLADGAGNATQGLIQLTVERRPLVIQTVSLPESTERQPFSTQFSAFGGTDVYSWVIADDSEHQLPPSLTLDPDTGVLSGTPALGDSELGDQTNAPAFGILNLKVQLDDGEQTTSVIFPFTINVAPLEILTTELPDGIVGQPYQAEIDFTTAFPSTSWLIDPGSDDLLPTGLSIGASTGIISGTPAEGTNGSYLVTVFADDTNAQDTQTFLLRIAEPINYEPTVDAGDRVVIGDTEYDGVSGLTSVGLMGLALDTNGDALDYLWTLIEEPNGGNLSIVSPESLNSDIMVAGDPIVAGSYTFELRVFESSTGAEFTDTFSLVVVGAEDIPPAAHAGNDIVAQADTIVTLSGSESSDRDGLISLYDWQVVYQPTGSNVVIEDAAATGRVPYSKAKFRAVVPGTYRMSLAVTDNDGLKSSKDFVDIVVTGLDTDNGIPRAVIEWDWVDNNSNGSVNVGELVQLNGSAEDAENDPILYTWSQVRGPSVVTLGSNSSASLLVSFPVAGTYRMRLDVNDTLSDGIPAEVTIVVAGTNAIAPIANASVSLADTIDGSEVVFIPSVGVRGNIENPAIELVSTGSFAANATYRWRQIAGPTVLLYTTYDPAGQNFVLGSDAATVSFAPTLSRVYSFELTVTDSSNPASPVWAKDVVTLAVSTWDPSFNPNGNAVPRATAGNSSGNDTINFPFGSVIGLNGSMLDFNDGDNVDNFDFHWTQVSGPPVVIFNPESPNPLFVPPREGDYVFRLFVDDGRDISLGDDVSIHVEGVGSGVTPSGTETVQSGCSMGSGNNSSLMALAGLLLMLLGFAYRRRQNA